MNNSKKKYKFISTLIFCLIPSAVVFSIWLPLIQYYYVADTYSLSADVIESLRSKPEDSVLEEIGKYGHFVSGQPTLAGDQNKNEITDIADSLLEGTIDLGNFSKTTVSLPFDPKDLSEGSSSWQLRFASFIVPRLLLVAYAVTADEKYFTEAKDYINKWRVYEESAWLPTGLIWNDHAMAGRVAVLTSFWRFYRHHSSYDADEARKFLKLIVDTGARLADPKQFTYATNHGIMQNLALLHLSLGFPAISQFQEYRQLAIDRLKSQLKFYVNDEGVILEHSAEYHEMGVELLGLMLRYFTLLKEPIPAEWVEKYEKTKAVYTALRLPDGSLPRWGDTSSGSDPENPAIAEFDSVNTVGIIKDQPYQAKPVEMKIYPAAGLSIWWRGIKQGSLSENLSQTLMTWSYYPGHGHKHADELSIILWAAGNRWWTNAGYWPYDDTFGRKQATSWPGSNAPHLIDESAQSDRYSTLLGSGWSSDAALVDVERQGPDGFAARRQLIYLKPDVWLVIDSFEDDLPRRTRTIWTSDNNISYKQGPVSNSFILHPKEGSARMLVYFTDNTSATSYVKTFTGSTQPFAGWVEESGNVKPAPAFIVEQSSSNTWSLALSILSSSQLAENTWSSFEEPRMLDWSGADEWAMDLSTKRGDITLHREDGLLSINNSSSSSSSSAERSVSIKSDFTISDTVLTVKNAYHQTASDYPAKFYDLVPYRLRATYALIILFFLQEVFFFITRLILHNRGRIIVTALRICSILAWLVVGWWLSEIYFSSIDTTFLQAVSRIISSI